MAIRTLDNDFERWWSFSSDILRFDGIVSSILDCCALDLQDGVAFICFYGGPSIIIRDMVAMVPFDFGRRKAGDLDLDVDGGTNL